MEEKAEETFVQQALFTYSCQQLTVIHVFLASPSVGEEVRRTLSGRARVRKRLSVFGCRLGSGARASNGILLSHIPAAGEAHVSHVRLLFRSTFLFFALSLFINCLSYPL